MQTVVCHSCNYHFSCQALVYTVTHPSHRPLVALPRWGVAAHTPSTPHPPSQLLATDWAVEATLRGLPGTTRLHFQLVHQGSATVATIRVMQEKSTTVADSSTKTTFLEGLVDPKGLDPVAKSGRSRGHGTSGSLEEGGGAGTGGGGWLAVVDSSSPRTEGAAASGAGAVRPQAWS